MGRSPCCDKNGIKKGPWTAEEDHKLLDYISKNGYGNWRTLPNNAGLKRCGKSCRLRWINYLRPDIKRGKFTLQEEELIIHLHSLLGNKWSVIAGRLPGRTDNEIKNYWNTHIRKRLLRMGIDPVTHNPRLDLLDLSWIDHLYCPSISQQMYPIQSSFINPEILRLATSLFPNSEHDSSSVHSQIPLQDNNIDLQHQYQPDVYHSSNIAIFNPESSYEEPNGMGCDYGDSAYLQHDVFENNNEVPCWINLSDNVMNLTRSSTPIEMNSSYTYVGSVEEERGTYCSNDYDKLMFGITDI